MTNQLYYFSAEPLKKKKKIDPAIIKAREERRRKKIEKQIRRLQKNARQLKPIEEMEIPLNLLDQIGCVCILNFENINNLWNFEIIYYSHL